MRTKKKQRKMTIKTWTNAHRKLLYHNITEKAVTTARHLKVIPPISFFCNNIICKNE